MRLFTEHPNATGGENGVPSSNGCSPLHLRLRIYCESHIAGASDTPADASPQALDRRFTAFFTAARRDGHIAAGRCPKTMAHLFVALLAGLDLRRAGGAPLHELQSMAAGAIALIVD